MKTKIFCRGAMAFLSVVLVISAQQASAIDTQYTTDGGKTWHDGDYQPPSRGGDTGASQAPSGPSPQQLEEQRQHHQAMMTANQNGLDAYKNSDWAEAARYFREALQYDPNNATVKENLRSAEQQLTNAQASEKIRQDINAFAASLRNQPSALSFDGNQQSAVTPSSSGLQFMGPGSSAAPKTSSTAPSAGGASPGAQPLTFMDSSVVDLRDAKTLTVDPAKLKGPATGAETASVSQFRDEMEKAILKIALAKSKGNKETEEQEWDKMLDTWVTGINRLDGAAKALRIQTPLDNLARQLEMAHDRIRKQELATFKELRAKALRDMVDKIKAADELKAQGLFNEAQAEDAADKAAKDIVRQLEEALNAADAKAQQDLQAEFRRIMGQ